MTDNAPAAAPDDVRLLAGDLATVCGTLSEIATAWRRAWQSRRGPRPRADRARPTADGRRTTDDACC